MRTACIFLVLLIATTSIAYAQKINFKAGDEFTVKANNMEAITPGQNRHHEYTFSIRVLNADNGIYKLQCNLMRFKLNESVGKFSSSINTDSIKQTDINSSAMLAPLVLLQKNFTVDLNSKGAILNISGYDELVQQAIKNWSLSAQSQDWALNNTKVFITTTFKKIFFELPQSSITNKLTWSRDAINFFVDNKQGNLAYVSASNSSKSFTGKYVLDIVRGVLVKATTSQKDDNGRVLVAGNYLHTISEGKPVILPADTAWINMAMSMSFMSNRFKNSSGEGDSAKVFDYLAANNKRFKNDAYYNRTRLGLIQSVRASSANLLYDSLLSITPNHYLAGNYSALLNKSHRALQNSADSAYGVIRYYYKDRSFNEWVQYSYSQNFISPADPDEKPFIDQMRKRGLSEAEIVKNINNIRRTKENAYLLLEKLHNDKTTLIQQKTKPMYLWVTAVQKVNNQQTLNTIAAQFNKLDDDYMKEGNGARYGMLLYKTFADAGQKKNANAILQKVIADLTRYQADTLYGDRYIARSLLAHAYYMHYNETLPTDSVKALQYLSKAALYSPSSAREKAYGSFYDRVFLNSKESYANDYVQALFKNGDSDHALTVFAQYISSDLEHLAEAQSMFEKRFPNKSFKTFFADRVVTGWATAPEFALKGPDNNKEYALAGYKGKWLLTDFWGTWCGPCREEMPEVNKFSNAVQEGKLPGWAFLSIACMDNAPAVNKYLADNKYSIPVAMGDDKIANNYKINGYPSKILISPTGKMISTSFGANWRAIVAKVNELYPAQ